MQCPCPGGRLQAQRLNELGVHRSHQVDVRPGGIKCAPEGMGRRRADAGGELRVGFVLLLEKIVFRSYGSCKTSCCSMACSGQNSNSANMTRSELGLTCRSTLQRAPFLIRTFVLAKLRVLMRCSGGAPVHFLPVELCLQLV